MGRNEGYCIPACGKGDSHFNINNRYKIDMQPTLEIEKIIRFRHES